MKTVVLTDTAAKELQGLPQAAQKAVEDALDRCAMNGAGDVKALKGSGYLRMRVGRYRVIFDENTMTILAIYIGKRETTTYRKGRM